VNSEGQSLIALAVANATAPGAILTSNRTGGSCDLAGASSSTTVPAKTTSGTPINPQGTGGGSSITYWAATGAFISLFGGSDSPPGLGGGGSARGSAGNPFGALPRAGGGGVIPPSDGNTRCPNGYNRVTGTYKSNYIDVFAITYSQNVSFVATSYPTVNYAGKFKPTWGAAAGLTWDQYDIAWDDPVNGAQTATSFTIPPTPGIGGFSAKFSIQANSYSCTTDAGTAGPTISATLRKVIPGDTLWDIAQTVYGDATRWPEIYAANTDVVGADPDLIFPGQVLRIP
jgi:hypothetical protein